MVSPFSRKRFFVKSHILSPVLKPSGSLTLLAQLAIFSFCFIVRSGINFIVSLASSRNSGTVELFEFIPSIGNTLG